MKAEEFKKLFFVTGINEKNINDKNCEDFLLILPDKLPMKKFAEVYNSLKRLEEIEAKQNPTPKYVLARDVEGIANKGVEVFLDDDGFWKAPPTDGGHVGIIENPIAHKSAIAPTLIEEVKPREFWANEYKEPNGFGSLYSSEVKAKFNMGTNYLRTIHLIEVLNER